MDCFVGDGLFAGFWCGGDVSHVVQLRQVHPGTWGMSSSATVPRPRGLLLDVAALLIPQAPGSDYGGRVTVECPAPR